MEQRVRQVAVGYGDAFGLPPSPAEQRLAFIAGATCLVVFLVLVPFARQPLAPLWAFIPLYQSALVMCDLLTAWLLYARFAFGGGRSLLVLGSAYVFTAAITVAHTLSFPGLFAPAGLLGAGPQTTAWLYMAWHAVFPLLVIGYVLAKRVKSSWPKAGRGAAIAKSAALAVLLAGGLALVAGAGQAVSCCRPSWRATSIRRS
jgi:hypothetical protein